MDPAIRKMARELTRLLQMVKPLEEQAASICKDMSQLYNQMNDNFLKLSVVTAQIQKAYEKVASKFDFDHFTRVADLYKDLNTTFIDWGRVQKSTTTNWFKNIRMMFAFSSQEEAGMQSVRPLTLKTEFVNFNKLVKLRNGFSEEYKERKIELEKKKEHLWKSGDLGKWKVDQDNLGVKLNQLSNDKKLAKKHMLPQVKISKKSQILTFQETQCIANLKEIWAYYNSQIINQTKYFSELKMKRMANQINSYVKRFNSDMNDSFGLFVNISTKLMMLGVS